jgi:autotransporter-associated beta strand protein
VVWDGGGGDALWSTAANWVGDVVPPDGASLTFRGTTRQENENDLLTSVADVTIENGGFHLAGDALELAGELSSTAGEGGLTLWDIETTVASDAASVTSASGQLELVKAVHLHDGTAGHPLAVAGDGDVRLDGDVDGTGTACGLVKDGAGELELLGDNAFEGPVDVIGGAVRCAGAAALPAGVPLDIGNQTTVIADVKGKDEGAGTWDNVITGSGTLLVKVDHLRLTADSDDFWGFVQVDGGSLVVDGDIVTPAGVELLGGGTLGGDGSIQRVTVSDGCRLWPGIVDLVPATFTAGVLTMGEDGIGAFAIEDAAGVAGTGYDTVSADTAVVIGTSEKPFVIPLVSVAAGAEGACANWDPDTARRWHVVEADTLAGFSLDRVVLNTAQFAGRNDLGGGVFSLEQGTDGSKDTIDVVFTPVADFRTGPAVGDGGVSFAKGSQQKVAWEMDVAPPAGSVFKVVADDPGSATNVLLATVPATSATEYGYDWTIAQGPSTGWHVTVQLWSGPGDTSTEYRTRDSQTFDIVPAEYTIESSVVGTPGHGTIAPSGSVTVAYGATPTFTFTPEEGYRVKEVKVDGEVVTLIGENEYTFAAVTAGHTISVEFMLEACLITVTPGAHGSITPGTGYVEYGSSPAYTIAPDPGYDVADVVVDGDSVGAVTTYQFTDVTAAHTITAAFAVDPSGRPTTTVTGATSSWVNHPVTMTFTGHSGAGGSPIAFTEYSIDGGAWVQGTSCTVGAEGVSTVQYRSQDQDGVLEDPAKQATVRVDTRRPRVKAGSLTARRGAIVRVRYRVADPLPSSGSALVRLVVRSRSGKVMTRSSSVPVIVNRWLRIRVSTYAIHTPGVYTVSLRAKDRAGNWQRGWTRARLTIR